MRHPDIDRLEKVAKLYERMKKIFYHMDEKEYKRMKDYIYARHGILLPSSLPVTD